MLADQWSVSGGTGWYQNILLPSGWSDHIFNDFVRNFVGIIVFNHKLRTGSSWPVSFPVDLNLDYTDLTWPEQEIFQPEYDLNLNFRFEPKNGIPVQVIFGSEYFRFRFRSHLNLTGTKTSSSTSTLTRVFSSTVIFF